MVDIYFWRQSLVLCAGLFYSLSIGFMIAFPAVLNPAIMSSNSTDIRTTGDHASWIASVNGIGGFLGALGQSPVMQMLGRKWSHYSINASLCIGWIIFPFARNIGALYAARMIQGISSGAIYINYIIISEYVHPRRRGYFTALNKSVMAIGTLCCHAMSAFWTWRQIAIFASIFPIASIVLTFFWPESPSYLALRGRFTECEKSFKWLNGNSEDMQMHLNSLVETQKGKQERNKNRNKSCTTLWQTFLQKDFQKTFLVSSALSLSLDLSGRYYFVAYNIQIMMELLDSKTSAFYFTIISDIFTLAASALSTVVLKYFRRRAILLSTGIFGAFLMLSISLLVYLKTVYTFSTYFHWFTALIIILQSFIVNVGLTPVVFAINGEIFPLENKGFAACVSGIVFTSLFAITLKLTPVLIEYTELYGTYAIYGVGLLICLVFLYKAVPETKDKTLLEIENELKCGRTTEIISMDGERLMS